MNETHTDNAIIGYCMKCKHKEEMVDVKKLIKGTMKGDKYMLKGICKVCGTKVTAMINKTTFDALRLEDITEKPKGI